MLGLVGGVELAVLAGRHVADEDDGLHGDRRPSAGRLNNLVVDVEAGPDPCAGRDRLLLVLEDAVEAGAVLEPKGLVEHGAEQRELGLDGDDHLVGDGVGDGPGSGEETG